MKFGSDVHYIQVHRPGRRRKGRRSLSKAFGSFALKFLRHWTCSHFKVTWLFSNVNHFNWTPSTITLQASQTKLQKLISKKTEYKLKITIMISIKVDWNWLNYSQIWTWYWKPSTIILTESRTTLLKLNISFKYWKIEVIVSINLT